MSNPTKKWFALYTRPGCEKKVANLLSRKNIENYCPLKRHLNGRKKVVLEPLFSSYVFVKIADSVEMQHIRKTDSVVNFVYWLGKPAVIEDEEIEIIKRFMNEYANVKMERVPFDIDGMARAIEGPVADNKAHLVTVINNTVKIVLPSLGYMMLAEVEKSDVALITTVKKPFIIGEIYQFAI